MDQPTDPSPRKQRMLFRHSKIPLRALAPNFFTLLSLCAGLTAIRMTFEGRFETAVLLVAVAGLIDGIDGRLARALKVQSRFGAELDSLADTVNFGVAPALLLYVWGLGGLKEFGWVAAMVFACCMGLRLARFNASIDTEKPKWMGNYFTGPRGRCGRVVTLLP
jgi:CDP-diacylglycerol---serine O-phosphatidyltransferase